MIYLRKTLKHASASALTGSAPIAAFAWQVPLNTTVSGGFGMEKIDGKIGGVLLFSLGNAATGAGLIALLNAGTATDVTH